ncbi:MAG TPA: hypothetical protein PLV92_03765, partial [Pirellulaceae bacterium]|nr:hypothetical protein [Pirellulaceae bacterium]
DWGQDSSVDASKPLSILKHVGDAPLLMVAGRSKPQPEGYELLASVVPRAFYYAQQVNEFGADPEQAAKLKKVAEEFGPLLKKFDKITRDSLQPALADGQAALVVDAKTTHKQWHSEMPESAKPLALPSPALVVGVKDSAKLQQAAEGYFGLLQEALDKLHKLDPENVPEFKIPAPQSRDFPTGKIYYYSLPEEAGLAKIVAPNAGLTGEFAVLSLLPQQTRRLLEPSTLTAGGPLANVDRPLAAAAIVDFAGMIDLLGAWLDYGTNLAPPEAQLGLAQVPSILPLLKCWRGATAVSYKEGTATVTHSESHFADLP